MEEKSEKPRKVSSATQKARPDIEKNRIKPSSARSTAETARAKAGSRSSSKTNEQKSTASVSRGQEKNPAPEKKQGSDKKQSDRKPAGQNTRKQTPRSKESVEEVSVPARKVTVRSARSYRSEDVSIPPLGHRNLRKSEENQSLNRLFIVLTAVLVLILGISLISFLVSLRGSDEEVTAALPQPAEVTSAAAEENFILTIESGMSASAVARALEGVTDTAAFLDYLEANGLASSLRTGSYSVPYGISAEVLATALTTRSDSFIVYAGETIEEIDRSLSNRGLSESGDFRSAADKVVAERGLSFAEGWFLAGTYKETDAYELAVAMNDALLALIRREAAAVAESGLSLDEIVILSSMINRETQDAEQMRIISRVLLNRLAVGMPLGVDATTRYETGNWTSEIRQSTFEQLTPYNTRRQTGLPPTGIGSPSEAAVLAVLYPGETDDLYYLHDEEGKLYTSPDYDTHLETYRQVH